MQSLIKDLIVKNNTRIIFLVLDGLGGLPIDGKSELEAANIPNMDMLSRTSACGVHIPVAAGITPGSGPGHLALFGYDPKEYQIGRGVLEAVGLGLDVGKTDVAVRCNYATIEGGIIKDRRAGRIATEESRRLTERLQKEIPEIDGVKLTLGPGMEHRFAVVFRFPVPVEPAAAFINDTDPQKEGKPPLKPVGANPEAERVARVVEKFLNKAANILKDEKSANYALMRGVSTAPHLQGFDEAYGLKALAVANYPMYRGIAKLLGMEAPAISGGLREEVDFLKANFHSYDFFFVHVKKVDSFGEDGNFEGKTKRIEEVDAFLPEILSLNPDVLVITGDHSTPCLIKGHSWHPVPVLLKSPYVFGGTSSAFTERECLKGEFGIFPSVSLMTLVLANAGRLKKFGA